MDPVLAASILIIILFVVLATGIWIAMSLTIVGYLGLLIFSDVPIGSIMATSTWGAMASWTLTTLPLFIWMGEILFRTRLSEELFRGLAPWLTFLPGRLIHTNIIGSAIFAAVSGSSAATAATIGKMTLPELARRGYHEGISIGSLAGAATLGLLIPPSIVFIVYGISAEVSIARLFMAGVLPGIMLVVFFMGYVVIWSLFNPSAIPHEENEYTTFAQKIEASKGLIPILILIGSVLGSLYIGIATAIEAAALGVLGALILSWVSGTLSWRTFSDSLLGAVRTSGMIGFIMVGAAFLTMSMGFTHIPTALAEWINSLHLTNAQLLVVLTIFYGILGCFLDGISIVVLTTSVILPMIKQANIDLIWFGVYLVIVVEMAQITPPVGFNLFVIQGLTGRNIFYIAKAALPFFFILIFAILVLVQYPEIATWLPKQMTTR
jgi:tripartite ATP-independent transporter DctM subunit